MRLLNCSMLIHYSEQPKEKIHLFFGVFVGANDYSLLRGGLENGRLSVFGWGVYACSL